MENRKSNWRRDSMRQAEESKTKQKHYYICRWIRKYIVSMKEEQKYYEKGISWGQESTLEN